MKKTRANLNHIGIAVKDVAQMQKLFAVLGLEISHSESVKDQGVVTHFIPLPSDQATSLELLEVSDPEGTVSQFIRKRGPGIHHLSFLVESGKLKPLCDNLRSAGYKLVYNEAKMGAHRMRINFIHPASAGGILIEIMEQS